MRHLALLGLALGLAALASSATTACGDAASSGGHGGTSAGGHGGTSEPGTSSDGAGGSVTSEGGSAGGETGGTGGTGGSGGEPGEPLPDAVIAAGYTKNTFSTKKFDATNIDLANTKAPGFAWYPYNFFSHTDVSKIVPNADGSLTLAGDTTGPNGEIVSATTTGGTGFVGTAFGGGAYFEAVLSFDPQDVVDHMFKGWPSWWAVPLDHLINNDNTWWNRDPSTNYDHHIELDFFEYDVQGADRSRYGATIHDWYGVPHQTCAPGQYCDWHTPASANYCVTPTGTDFTEYHAYGMLWVPATATKDGSVTSFFDRKMIGTQSTWKKWVNVSPPQTKAPQDPAPSWALRWTDEMHYLLILGTGVGEPMKVQAVNVWQSSADENMHH